MDKFNEAMQTLQQKKQVFMLLEQQSEQMLTIPANQLEKAVENRQKLLEQIQALDEGLRALCKDWRELAALLNHECLPSTSNQQAIYQLDSEIKAIANRILRGEKAIQQHICAEQNRIREKIENINKSGYTVAKKYQQSVMTGNVGHYGSKKSRDF